jgi:2-polyprenyl-3-methyl-5-hydroxy-6-metoxy-1,4-benzoquinol methylase
MSLLCPECRQTLDPATLACPMGHRFGQRDGVLVLLQDEFGRRLQRFAAELGAIRAAENRARLDRSAYEELPFAAAVARDPEWRLRRHDIAVLSKRLASAPPLRILDVGAWNGWLSHRLAARGHAVTAVDYFADAYDGLGARRLYSTTWRAIQMDIADLSLLDETYDLVVLNRCVQFFTDPVAYVASAQQRVAAGGSLVLTGLHFFRAPGAKARQVAALRRHYHEKYSFELFLRPTRGFLDHTDREGLRRLGVTLRPYPQLWLANTRAVFFGSRPRHYHGAWTR